MTFNPGEFAREHKLELGLTALGILGVAVGRVAVSRHPDLGPAIRKKVEDWTPFGDDGFDAPYSEDPNGNS